MTRTAWNSTLKPGRGFKARDKGLARGPAPERRTPVKKRNAKRGGSLFPHRRDKAYCAWIRSLPCHLASVEAWIATPWDTLLDGRRRFGECDGSVECAHVRTRGAGGADRGNTVPLCRRHHREQHADGIQTFQVRYNIDLAAVAQNLVDSYPAPPKAGQK